MRPDLVVVAIQPRTQLRVLRDLDRDLVVEVVLVLSRLDHALDPGVLFGTARIRQVVRQSDGLTGLGEQVAVLAAVEFLV